MNPTPDSLGGKLREAREARGLTPSQLAELTRIKIQQIEGLENNDFSAIPAPMYAKGFLKILAQELALDARQLVALYEEMTHAEPPPPPAREGARRPVALQRPSPDTTPTHPQRSLPTLRLPAFLTHRRLGLLAAGTLLLLLLLLLLLSLRGCAAPDSPVSLEAPLLSDPPPVFLELPRTLP